jgi:hypothetical protein
MTILSAKQMAVAAKIVAELYGDFEVPRRKRETT